MEFYKHCSLCGRKQTYSRKSQLKVAIRKDTPCNSCKQIGGKNPFFGKKHSDEQKKKISEWNKNRGDEINNKISKKLKGRKISEETKKKISENLKGRFNGNLNPNYGNKLSEEKKEKIRQLTIKQHYNFKKTEEYKKYFDSLSELKKYKKLVWEYTNKNDLTILENYEKRGAKRNNDEAYHLDHIFPITMGFINNIPAELIGNIKNLKFIHWCENIKKGNKIKEIPEHIKDEYEKKRKKGY